MRMQLLGRYLIEIEHHPHTHIQLVMIRFHRTLYMIRANTASQGKQDVATSYQRLKKGMPCSISLSQAI